jgi:hypothetical protein
MKWKITQKCQRHPAEVIKKLEAMMPAQGIV